MDYDSDLTARVSVLENRVSILAHGLNATITILRALNLRIDLADEEGYPAERVERNKEEVAALLDTFGETLRDGFPELPDPSP